MRRLFIFAVTALTLSSSIAGAQTFAPPPQTGSQPAAPLPKWARVAFFNVDRVMTESAVGKAGLVQLETLRTRRASEADSKAKTLQAAQQSLQIIQPAAEPRSTLAKNVEKLQLDLQRFVQDAQAELQSLEAELGKAFQKNLLAAVERVAKDKGVDLVFSQTDAGLAWGNPAFDLSSAIVEKMNAASPR